MNWPSLEGAQDLVGDDGNQYAYNDLDQLASERTYYAYGGNGNLAGKGVNGATTEYRYDLENRLTAVYEPGETSCSLSRPVGEGRGEGGSRR